MYEAHYLARIIAQLLDTDAHVSDGGADYRIVVTDKAGNAAEISCDLGQWTWAEEVDLSTLRLRLRLTEEET